MVTIFVTGVIAVIGFLQYSVYRQQKTIMESSGHQMDKLIDYAKAQASAASQIAEASDKSAKSAGFP